MNLIRRFNLALALFGALILTLGGGTLLLRALGPATAEAATVLNATTDTLELITGTAVSTVSVTISYVDFTSSDATPGASGTNITTATTTTVLAAPAAGTQRQLKVLSVDNGSVTPVAITLQKDVSGTKYTIFSVTLQASETLRMDSSGGFTVYDNSGAAKVPNTAMLDGMSLTYMKIGATSEAAGLWQNQSKDTGFPSAWVPGVPGLAGDAVSCNTAADAVIAGSFLLTNPTTGGYYLTSYNETASIAHTAQLVDLIWFNTGLNANTPVAQTFTQVALPARDQYGAANGDGWQAAILVTTATTNAAAVTNTTLQYTNSGGTTTRTGTFSAAAPFPATAVAGTFIPFQLQAGDRGIRAITGVTLGTTYGSGGAISLVMYRPLAMTNVPLANVGAVSPIGLNTRIWNGTCFWNQYLATATTLTNSQGVFTLAVR